MYVKLYTSPTCGNCPAIKKALDESGISYELIVVNNEEGKTALFNEGVKSVPYISAENRYGSEYKALGNGININSLKAFLT